MIEVIETEEGFDALEKEWKHLQANPSMTIFQSYDFVRTAWREFHKGDTLLILKWTRDNSKDVVIFPFYIDKKGTLRFIFDFDSDITNVVYSSESINRSLVYREAISAIKDEKRIKAVCLRHMDGKSEAMHFFGTLLPGAMVAKESAYSYVRIKTPGEFSASQEQLKSEERKHLRYILKKSDGYEFKVLSLGNCDEFPETEIRRLRQFMIDARVRSDWFLTDKYINLIRALYEKGLCELPVLIKDGRMCAMNIHYRQGDYVLAWIFLGENPNFGTEIDVRYCVEYAKTNAGRINFGLGAYEYKLLTFRPFTRVVFTVRYGKTYMQHIKQGIAMCWRFAKDYIKARRK